MKNFARITSFFVFYSILPAIGLADPKSAVDEEWQMLSRPAKRNAEPASSRAASSQVAKAQAAERRQGEALALVDRADQFKKFQQRNPKDRRVKEAKRQEAILLLQAGLHGDQKQNSRRKQLAQEIRSDRSFTTAERLEVAGYADNLDVLAQRIAVPAELTSTLEKVARRLVAEFPEAPAGYESLLSLAKSSPDEQSKVLFGDLLEMPASDAVKMQAAQWLERHALVGHSLIELVGTALGADKRLDRARSGIIVLYTWSANDNTSIELAKQIGSIQMPGLTLFGVNLDSPADVQRARDTASLLPGEQLVLGRGADCALAKALLLDETPLIYVTDRKGVLFTVSAHNRPSRAIIDASLR